MAVPQRSWRLTATPTGLWNSKYPAGNPPPGVLWNTIPNFNTQEGQTLSVGIRQYLAVDPGAVLTVSGSLPTGWSFDGELLAYSGTGIDSSTIAIRATASGDFLNSNNFTCTASAGLPLIWPIHSPAYLPTLPGHAAFGMDANGGGLPTNVYFVDSLATNNAGTLAPSLGANVWRCTWEFAWKHNNTGRHKVIIPLVSGWIPFRRVLNSVQGVPNMSYWGQCAPGMGLFLRGTNANVNGSVDARIWHLPSYMGDDLEGTGPGNRDCIQSGNRLEPNTARVLLINCECAWGIDELFQIYYAMDNFSALYNAFIDPLHIPPGLGHPEDPPGFDHGYGPLAGAEGGYCNRISFMRNLFAHCTGRQPMTQAQNYAHANNLHYNPGRPDIGQGNCVTFINNAGTGFQTTPMLSNVVRNLVVRGPNNNNTLTLVRALNVVPASSACFLSGNAQHGWSPPANQAAFVTDAPVGFAVGSLQSAAWPAGWGTALQGTLAFAANPLAPTTEEKENFTDLICATVGVKPAYRASYSRINTIQNQIIDAINGVVAAPQMVNSVAEAGGWFNVPELTIADPTNPGTHWHAAPPLGATRDDILTTGTFSNGRSKAGYSNIVAWAIEQHYFVGGS